MTELREHHIPVDETAEAQPHGPQPERGAITKRQLQKLVSGFRQITDRLKAQYFPQNETASEANYESYGREVQEKYEELVRLLRNKTGKFERVFTTAHGSHYFVLRSGEALRIKRIENGSYTNVELTDRLFFLSPGFDPHEADDTINWNKVIGKRIPLTECAPGVRPIDFNAVRRNAFEVRGNTLVIRSPSGIHIGTPIKEVIK